MARIEGLAENTAFVQRWLNECDAVTLWRECGEYIDFEYRTDVEVTSVPQNVWFDTDAAPKAARDASLIAYYKRNPELCSVETLLDAEPDRLREIPEADRKALAGKLGGSLRQTYTGGILWRKHNPNTKRCRCAECMAGRK